MSDVIDKACDREQLDRDLAIKSAREAGPEAPVTGHCLWCNAELTEQRRWCDAWCQEDWNLAQEARKRHRGRR